MRSAALAGSLAFLAGVALALAADCRPETAVERGLAAAVLVGLAVALARVAHRALGAREAP